MPMTDTEIAFRKIYINRKRNPPAMHKLISQLKILRHKTIIVTKRNLNQIFFFNLFKYNLIETFNSDIILFQTKFGQKLINQYIFEQTDPFILYLQFVIMNYYQEFQTLLEDIFQLIGTSYSPKQSASQSIIQEWQINQIQMNQIVHKCHCIDQIKQVLDKQMMELEQQMNQIRTKQKLHQFLESNSRINNKRQSQYERRQSNKDISEMKTELPQCSYCNLSCSKYIQLPCLHSYHQDCLNKFGQETMTAYTPYVTCICTQKISIKLFTKETQILLFSLQAAQIFKIYQESCPLKRCMDCEFFYKSNIIEQSYCPNCLKFTGLSQQEQENLHQKKQARIRIKNNDNKLDQKQALPQQENENLPQTISDQDIIKKIDINVDQQQELNPQENLDFVQTPLINNKNDINVVQKQELPQQMMMTNSNDTQKLDQIQQSQQEQRQSNQDISEQSPQLLKCSYCNQSCSNYIKLPCLHSYHQDCLEELGENAVNNMSTPICICTKHISIQLFTKTTKYKLLLNQQDQIFAKYRESLQLQRCKECFFFYKSNNSEQPYCPFCDI